MNTIKEIRFLLVVLLSCLIAYSYHPTFFNSEGEIIGVGLTKYIMGSICAIIAISIPKLRTIFKEKIIKFYAISLVCISIISLLLYSLDLTKNFSEIRTLTIPFIAICIGYIIELDEKKATLLSLAYIVTILYVGYSQIETNIGGLIIEEQYLTNAKNSLGPMICMGGLLALLISLTYSQNRLFCISMLCLCITALIEVLTIRARFVTIIFFALSFLLAIKTLKLKYSKGNWGKRVFYVLLFGGIISCGIIYFQEYITNSLFLNRETDITSGRTDTYTQGVKVFLDNPIFGNLALKREIGWVHNYFLLKLSDYGLIVSLPWLILYIKLFLSIIKGFWKEDTRIVQNYGWVILLISFIVSLAEPTYPFGPGTTNFLPFLLWGISLKNQQNVKQYEF